MAVQSAQRRQPPAEIPDRLYYRIGDVARICGVEPYVLRFWETQFPNLKPNKGGTGQRLYRRREVELALRIRQLVHQEGYTLAGARQALEAAPRRSSERNQGVLALTEEQAQKRLETATAAIGRARAGTARPGASAGCVGADSTAAASQGRGHAGAIGCSASAVVWRLAQRPWYRSRENKLS